MLGLINSGFLIIFFLNLYIFYFYLTSVCKLYIFLSITMAFIEFLLFLGEAKVFG